MGTTDQDAADDRHRPLIDVSPALGEAGHEEELLGTEDVPDTAPVVRRPDDPDRDDLEAEVDGAIATRGIDPVD